MSTWVFMGILLVSGLILKPAFIIVGLYHLEASETTNMMIWVILNVQNAKICALWAPSANMGFYGLQEQFSYALGNVFAFSR